MTDIAETRGLPKAYDPAVVEPGLYAWWEDSDFFRTDADDPGEPFCIVIPLPNVTGSLHVGHALDHSIQDALTRQQRMAGANALWLPGTDHAGIATQNVVERQLAEEGLTRHDVGREAFLERVWAWKEESGGLILRQMRRLGASCDWSKEAFTLDEPRSKAVREVFCALYEDGLIYRGNRLINWCPRCASAISDIEVDHTDEQGELAYLRYPAADGGDGVVVATTRPETMLGDTAVAVHPDDDRYRDLVGATVILPLLDRELPVIADDAVDPSFGTGAVKVTPAHDPNDHEIGQRHDLDLVDMMTDEARISDAGGPYAGLDRFEAREQIKADLDARGLLVKVEVHEHAVGRCSRCETIVEPRLSDQWFVAVTPLAREAIAAVRDGRTEFIPARNAKGFLDWLENLRDWCISRQIWWGHRIPAWYDRDGDVHVYREDPAPEDVEAKGLVRDPDVLDTWFSSALWPFTTLGWTEPGSDTPELRTWYPTSVLVTGYDINTFWVSRMLMMGLRFMDDVPFHRVVNHGLVRDRHGKKMSKSFQNVIDPLELIDRYGADALRFALLRAASPGQDAPLAEEWVEGARRFANKLWNAARFVLGAVGKPEAAKRPEAGGDPNAVGKPEAAKRPEAGGDPNDARPADGLPADAELELEDRWILSRLERTRGDVDAAFAEADLATAAQTLYHFVWDDYCDWYLELAKLRTDRATRQVLAHVLDVTVRLLHPITPFVTEAVWRGVNGLDPQPEQPEDRDRTVLYASWPAADPQRLDEAAEERFAAVQEVVTELRRFRAEHDLAPSARIGVTAVAEPSRRPVLEAAVDGIRRLAGVDDWAFADVRPEDRDGPVSQLLLSIGELYVPLTGLVDLDEERQRLSRELDNAQAEVARAEGKLANDGFVANAPDELVQAERDKREHWREVAEKLEAQLGGLS